ncbi:MAG TPA: lycopene cyclase domain-containing protein, partial [Anaerolineales bacterium]|nr:lycopene cyclase domain-containing protein [Anaerolineales bacterium]
EPTEPFKPSVNVRLTAFGILAAAWMVFTYLLFFGGREWTYLAIIFFWALPPIFPQMLYGADILWHHRRLVLAGILVPGTFLSLTDIVALTDTTWSIAKDQTTGILFFDILPIEEAA